MFLIDNDSSFKSIYRPNATVEIGDFLFSYKNGNIGLTSENKIPALTLLPNTDNKVYCFGHIRNRQCLLWDAYHSDDLNFSEARLSYQLLSEELYQAVAIGNHINHWRNSHRYCGKCGSFMTDKIDEQALICSQCAYIAYPKISPCAIVLISRGDEILLARSPHFMPNVMSTLAGFVEIGESVEQAVIREIKEEVGIRVNNLKYICSQPWPFPDSLMLGFAAEYEAGEITIDSKEIEKAGWFNKNNLPQLPNTMSIARYLIDKHLKKYNEK